MTELFLRRQLADITLYFGVFFVVLFVAISIMQGAELERIDSYFGNTDIQEATNFLYTGSTVGSITIKETYEETEKDLSPTLTHL